MKRFAASATCLVLGVVAAALALEGGLFNAGAQDGKPAPADPAGPQSLDSAGQKAGYAFGHNIGRKLRFDLDIVDLDALIAGIRDGAAGAKPRMKDEEIKAELEKLNAESNKRSAERAKKEGEEFLALNAKKDGVKVTASGLQYMVLVEGSGKRPSSNSVVKVHYEGKLVDGTVFDSTYERNEPVQFPLNRVIRGWTEGLQLMSEGSKYQLFVPSTLGYGPRGAGDVIPPHSTLIFTVELLEVK